MALPLIPLLPLAAFAVLILLGRRLGKLAPVVSLLALAGSLVLSVDRYCALPETVRLSWTWAAFGERTFSLGLQFDPLSAVMCLVVTVVGWLIMLYSVGYMHGEERFSRFFAYLSLFCSAMLLLVLADNFLLLYIGWELVGLCSYLLISFWFERQSAANAGMKAFLTTRVGDLGLLGAILLIGFLAKDFSFSDLAGKAAALGAWAPAVAILIFWGAAGKSAQFPLHVWLPDAMEGPTPVSALIHAATMVAAGVYLVARTLPLFAASPEALLTVATVGGTTSFFAATIACTQTDLKRILAYSTISQLGFMMLGLGCGAVFPGMFHLVTHAWFKALLFLAAGSVIHALHHQEITRMGGLWRPMPVTAATFLIASVAMAGIPPLSGFWSKEEIFAAIGHSLPAPFLFLALAISGLTAFYITRAAVLTFWGQTPRGLTPLASHARESPLVMTGPLAVLALGAAGVGLLGAPWAGNALQHLLGAAHGAAGDAPHAGPHWVAPVSVGVASAGILLAALRYGFGLALLPAGLRRALSPLRQLAARNYFVDEIYEVLLIRPVLQLCRRSFSFDARVIDGAVNGAGEAGLSLSRIKRWIDDHVVDGLVRGLGVSFERAGATLRLAQTGLVQNYLLIASAGAVAIFLLFR